MFSIGVRGSKINDHGLVAESFLFLKLMNAD